MQQNRFMSEARALTSFVGNAIATVLVATWTGELDRAQLERALSGEEPFDEATMLDEHDDYPRPAADAQPGRRDVAPSSLH